MKGFITSSIISISLFILYLYFVVGGFFNGLILSQTGGEVAGYTIGLICSIFCSIFVLIGCIVIILAGIEYDKYP